MRARHSPTLALRHHAPPVGLRRRVRRATDWIRSRPLPLVRRIRAVTPDRWFLIWFVLMLLAFGLVLLLQPSAVGRGGK